MTFSLHQGGVVVVVVDVVVVGWLGIGCLLAKQPIPSQLLFHSFTIFRERGKKGEGGVEA